MSLSIKPITQIPNKGLKATFTLPATPVVTTADAKAYCRVDFSEDDDLIDALVSSSTHWVQNKLNRCLINQTVVAEWDSVGYEVPLPFIPVGTISEVVTVNDEGTEGTLVLNTGYYKRNDLIKVSTPLGLKVTYTSGYGTASTDVPAPIITAIKRMTLALYDRRDDEVQETNIEQIEINLMALIQPYINYNHF